MSLSPPEAWLKGHYVFLLLEMFAVSLLRCPLPLCLNLKNKHKNNLLCVHNHAVRKNNVIKFVFYCRLYSNLRNIFSDN